MLAEHESGKGSSPGSQTPPVAVVVDLTACVRPPPGVAQGLYRYALSTCRDRLWELSSADNRQPIDGLAFPWPARRQSGRAPENPGGVDCDEVPTRAGRGADPVLGGPLRWPVQPRRASSATTIIMSRYAEQASKPDAGQNPTGPGRVGALFSSPTFARTAMAQ